MFDYFMMALLVLMMPACFWLGYSRVNQKEIHRSNPRYWFVEKVALQHTTIWRVVCMYGVVRGNHSRGWTTEQLAYDSLAERRAEFEKRGVL